MNNNTMQNKKRKGFTLFEMLIVVAIMVALFAVSAVSVNSIQKSIRQKKLDYCAELIYMAAQNQITELCVAEDNCYLPKLDDDSPNTKCDALALGYKPASAGAGATEKTYYYVYSWCESVNQTAQKLVPEGLIDETIRSGNWVIEYDPLSACVFAVFYSEGDRALAYSRTDVDFTTALRVKKARLADGAQIGYYGGDSEYNPNYDEMDPKIEVYNGEALVAYVSCISVDGSPVSFELTVSQEGRSKTIEVENGTPMGNVYQATVELDSLSDSSKQFHRRCSGLIPGEDITVTVTAHSSNLLIEDASATAEKDVSGNDINSLFASVEGDTAYISCARHLQNLDVNTSFVGTEGDAGTTQITKAVQTGDISFLDDGITQSRSYMEDWATYYKTSGGSCRKFSPIHNSQLQSYDGQSYSITGLQTNALATENAGLFAELSETTVLQNISLVSTKIAQGLNVGSLVGSISGTAYIVNCSSVLDARTDINTKYDSNLALGTNGCWIKGSPAGGLVGAVGNGAEVKIVNSYAATVVGTSSSAYAGGLVGINRGTLEITGCYADCYLNGRNTAGLVGFNTAVATLKLQSCYTAGYQTATTRAAGLCNGTIASANNVYSACCYQDMGSSAKIYGDAMTITAERAVYYLGLSSDNLIVRTVNGNAVNNALNTSQITGKANLDSGEKLVDALNDVPASAGDEITLPNGSSVTPNTKFVASPTVSTVAYNLLGQGLSNYTFPSFEGVAHYGDWLTTFEAGQLVYWEEYRDKNNTVTAYGFYGGNANTLLDEAELEENGWTIAGDGYGLAFSASSGKTAKDKTNEVPDANLWVAVGYTLKEDNTVTGGTIVQLTGTGGSLCEGVALSQYYVDYGNSGASSEATSSYYILKLPASVSDSAETSGADYWQKLGVFQGENAGSLKKDGSSKEFYYNPHFSKSAVKDSGSTPDLPTVISVRTARQLYDLSLYYEAYANVLETNGIIFQQELDIDYTTYDWKNCTKDGKEVKEQGAIGGKPVGDVEIPFASTYDGLYHTVTGVSFTSQKYSAYTGMFGLNTGTLKNIFLVANPEDKLNASFSGGIAGGSTDADYAGYYAGILLGRNKQGGLVENCATAGYSISVGSYNSDLYAGALVGGNQGEIRYCSAVFPQILISGQNSKFYVGGFCGWNSTMIEYCYALGSIELGSSDGSTVELAGFCATNRINSIYTGVTSVGTNRLNNCYCVTAITAANATISAFCPEGESGSNCNNCYYLNKGIYSFYTYDKDGSFAKESLTLDYAAKNSKGKQCTYDQLTDLEYLNLENYGDVKADNTLASYGEYKEGTEYPFPGVVRVPAASGRMIVHYGDWVESAIDQKSDVYYWEHEVFCDENGATTGEEQYRIAFAGDSSNLCDNHDDGGVIVEYGYGYFCVDGENSNITLEMTGFANAKKDLAENYAANEALAELNLGYEFHSYTTWCVDEIQEQDETIYARYKRERLVDVGEEEKTQAEQTMDNTLWLSSGATYGTWTLTDGNLETTDKDYTRIYYINPFFGAALSKDSKPGDSTGVPYQIRSTVQLQYINWNCETEDCDTAVTTGNYQKYPYLRYAKLTGETTMTVDNAGGSKQYWSQTHDIGIDNTDTAFYPIAGTYTGSSRRDGAPVFDAVLYAWFGGSYDGNSYKCLNLSIYQDLNNIGVFGYTCSAELDNIILYSDNSTVIGRHTNTTANQTTSQWSSYAIGGLVGIAYDYVGERSSAGSGRDEITNCAIAGYVIQDDSQNKRISCGDINIGGLFGIADADITNCSSVVDIKINCIFAYFGYYGNTVRVAGVAGCCPYALTNCYAGGKITVDKKLYDSSNYPTTDGGKYETMLTSNCRYSYVYASGICSGCYAGNFMNFTGKGDRSGDSWILEQWDRVNMLSQIYLNTKEMNLTDCYSYVNLNEINVDRVKYKDQDTGRTSTTCYIGIEAICAVGGIPERFATDESTWFASSKVTYNNCYYLSSMATTAKDHSGNLSALGYSVDNDDIDDNTKNNGACTWSEMTDGTLGGLLNSPDLETAAQRKEAYEAETDTDYAPVTTKENYSADGKYLEVPGKYSFPGDNEMLLGTNYPFPTIITQKNDFDELVHVHYGTWPRGTLMFGTYYNNCNIVQTTDVSMELLADGEAEGKTVTLTFLDDQDSPMSAEKLAEILVLKEGTIADDAAGHATMTVKMPTGNNSTYPLNFTARKTGVVKVKANINDGTVQYEASCQLTISGELTITAVPVKLDSESGDYVKTDGYDGYVGDETTVALYVSHLDTNNQVVSDDVAAEYWQLNLTGYDSLVESVDKDNVFSTITVKTDTGTENVIGVRLKYIGAGEAAVTVGVGTGEKSYAVNGVSVSAEQIITLEGWEANTVGLADTTGSQYTEITHQAPAAPVGEEPYHSYNNLTETGQISYARYDAGAAPKAEGYDLLVYAKGTGFDLEAFMKKATITVSAYDEETGTVELTYDENQQKYVAAGTNENFTLSVGAIQDVNGWDVAPLLFQCGGGKYQITIESQCGVKYLENGAEASAARTAGYTITLTYEREITEYTVDLYGYTNTSDIADGLAQKMGSLTVTYPELTVTAQNATDDATLPTYYEYVTDGQWQTWDALSQTVTPIGEGLTVSGNMALYRPIQGMEYTITLQHGDRTRTVTLRYGTDSTIPASMDLTYYGTDAMPEGYLFAQSEILDHWKGCDKDGTEFTLQDADELLAVMEAFEGVAVNDRILTAVLYDPAAENSLMQSYLAEAPEETLETESVSEESKEQETETRTTGE